MAESKARAKQREKLYETVEQIASLSLTSMYDVDMCVAVTVVQVPKRGKLITNGAVVCREKADERVVQCAKDLRSILKDRCREFEKEWKP